MTFGAVSTKLGTCVWARRWGRPVREDVDARRRSGSPIDGALLWSPSDLANHNDSCTRCVGPMHFSTNEELHRVCQTRARKRLVADSLGGGDLCTLELGKPWLRNCTFGGN